MQLSKKSIFAAACAAALLMIGSAHAADRTTVTVSAFVQPECKFSGGPYAIPFGNLSPSANVDAIKSVTINYQCTKGTAATSIKIGQQTEFATIELGAPNNKLPAILTWTNPVAVGTGIGATYPVISFDLTAKIEARFIAGAKAGQYSFNTPIDLLP